MNNNQKLPRKMEIPLWMNWSCKLMTYEQIVKAAMRFKSELKWKEMFDIYNKIN